MKSLARYWAGKLYGTNTGNVFLELDNSNNAHISGTLTLNDDRLGVAKYTITGSYQEDLKIRGKSQGQNQLLNFGDLIAEAKLTSQGTFRGTWSTTIGTTGIFDIYPHEVAHEVKEKNIMLPPMPEQINNKVIPIGAVSLCYSDIKRLLAEITKDFDKNSRLIITYNLCGHKITKYSEDFMKNTDQMGVLNELTIFLQEPELYGINKSVSILLGVGGSNKIDVRGVDETWVIGKAEKLASFFKKYQSLFITSYKKFGLNFNGLIFIFMLIFMPSIHLLWQRGVFAIVTFVILIILKLLHQNLVQVALIKMEDKKQNWLSKKMSGIKSFLLTIASGVLVLLITNYFIRF